jgi:eukaryotic-like serine/threonine-protein kinase
VILLTSNLRAKLSGFARGRNELGFSIPDSEVSKAPAAYVAPEQRDGIRYGNPGRRTDIYQLGVIFYELLTGYIPYTSDVYYKSGREGTFEDNIEELVLPSEIRTDLKPCDDILKKMLSIEKSGRYYLVNDLLADIDRLKWSDRHDDKGEQKS